MRGQRYTNGVLTAIAALLGLNFVGQAMDKGQAVSVASAQPEQYRRDGAAARPEIQNNDPTEGGMISAAEQRKIIIAELRNLGNRLASIEGKLGTGVNVTVTDMPEMNWPSQASSEPAAAPAMPAAPAGASAEPSANP